METEQSFTAKVAKDTKEEKSFTAEDAKVAEDEKLNSKTISRCVSLPLAPLYAALGAASASLEFGVCTDRYSLASSASLAVRLLSSLASSASLAVRL